jgi:formylglycine-generating enzyme required for sulfatase activity
MNIGDTAAKFDLLSLSEAELVDQACDRFEMAWRGNVWPCIEGYLDAVSGRCRVILLHELIKLELELRNKVGEQPTAEEYRLRFPDQATAIDGIFGDVHESVGGRSTFPDNILGSAAPDPDAVTLDARTLELDPGRMVDLPRIDGALGRLLGEYMILDRIGSGGMGVVYRAFQRSANRIVALKLIKAEWCGESTDAASREVERRFRNEAQVLAELEHDHIVPLYDVGHAEGLLFFSMRLINGRSLGQMVLSDGPMPPRRAAYYIEAIARAIDYAHQKKILHRDVKPGNILVANNDRPYLIDLGLAKSLDATDYTTLTGKALGTAEFMSPEQARGDDDIDFATDVYGVGATLFTLLTGRPPFTGPNPIAVLRKVMDEEPIWPRERDKPVGAELKAICLKCLEKNPANRFGSAGELAVVLKKYLNYEPTGISSPKPWARVAKWARRQPWRAAAVGIAMIATVVVALAGALAWNGGHRRSAAEALVREIPTVRFLDLPGKIDQMAPYRTWINPRLRHRLQNNAGDSELRARDLLALLPSEPEHASELADRLLHCGPEEHRVIREALRPYWPVVAPKLQVVVGNQQCETGQRVRAAGALIALDNPNTPAGRAWSELRLAPDPGLRVELLDWLIHSNIALEILADRLEIETDVSVRRQMFQALGARGDGQPPVGASESLRRRLLAQYRDDPDAGIHSSLAYLLRRWGMHDDAKLIDSELSGKPPGSRAWFVNSVGLTMAVLVVPDDHRPLPPEPGQPPERFSVATTETPLALFQEFDATHAARQEQDEHRSHQPRGDAPANELTYFEAARFCNWLSAHEGLPPDQWCYQPGENKGVWVLVPDYMVRRGYRLPSIQEWEYFARAGTLTDRYFGQGLDHINDFAWHRDNTRPHPQPIGRLRPNDFGLFDVIGNVDEWCFNPRPSISPERCQSCAALRSNGLCEQQCQGTKGGSFASASQNQSVQKRHESLGLAFPYFPRKDVGFRVVKSG